jgi:hypothetical protein
MKIIDIHSKITTDEVFVLLQQKLNQQFQQQRRITLSFNIEHRRSFIEINQPDLYEGFLFRIEVKDTKLCITRTADYINDVNALTIESILNILFEELAGDQGITLALEG